jgi:hypothetical protein
VWDTGTVPKFESIEHQGQTRDFGKYQNIKGLPDASMQLTCYAEGTGTAVADGTQSGETFLSLCVCSAFGVTSTRTDGSAVATGTDTTQIIQESETNAFSAGTIIAYDVDGAGTIECRPVASTATLTHTLAIDASADPADANRIYGTTNVLWSNPTSKQTVTGVFEFRGMDDADTWRVYNVIPNVVFNSVGRNEVQTITISGPGGGGFADDVSSSLTQPSGVRPVVAADGEALLAPSGSNQTGTALTLFNWSLDLGIAPLMVPTTDPTQRASSMLLMADPVLTLTLLHDFNPPGGTDGDLGALFRDANDNSLQFFQYSGTAAGSLCGVWVKQMHIIEDPEHTEVDGVRAVTARFKITTGVTDPAITFFQG